MDKPLELSEDEQLRFMRSIYSVFYRDEKINEIEQSVLTIFNHCFDLTARDYKHYVHNNPVDIANEINNINDIRVRIYFMRIIFDVYQEEIKDWFNDSESAHARRFRVIYSELQKHIITTEN